MSFISYLRFDVKPGCREAFLSAFTDAGMLTRPKQIPGYHWGKLNEDADGSGFIVIAEWAQEKDYLTWQGMSFEGLDRSIIERFLGALDNPTPGKLFKTVLTSSPTM